MNADARSSPQHLYCTGVRHGGMGIGAPCAAPPETPSAQQAGLRSLNQSPKSCPLASLSVVGVGSLLRCDAALRVVGAASQFGRAAC